MIYLNFLDPGVAALRIAGSTLAEVDRLEVDLGFKIPVAFREYLLLMGEETNLHHEWHEHGTKSILGLRDWIGDWISRYRSQGLPLEEIQVILPFFKFQDTFFFIPIRGGDDDPPVYAFDINDEPTIRKMDDSFSGFVRRKYEQLLKRARSNGAC